MKFKISYLFVILLLLLTAIQCVSQKKITYVIPENYTPAQKEDFLKSMEKGQALYKANCGSCHGIFTKGEDYAPNFTHEQVDNYSAAYLRGDPKNHAVALKMSNDQFFSVMAFLSSRKVDTTGHKVRQPQKPVIEFGK